MSLKGDRDAAIETLARENAALELRARGLQEALMDAQEKIGKLQSLRAAARDMREAQKHYFKNRHQGATHQEARRLEKAYDKLDNKLDAPQKTLFDTDDGPEIDEATSAKCQAPPEAVPRGAQVVPKGPHMMKLVAIKTVVLARPAGCPSHVKAYPGEFRTIEQNRVDAVTWTKGAVDIILATGQAKDHEDAARKILNGILKSEGLIS